MDMLKQSVLKTIKKYDMFQAGDKVLIGVSGGPDSVALLLVLNEISKQLRIDIFVASLNHMFRDKESKMDIKFVKDLTIKLKLPFIAENVDVPKIWKKSGGSKEELARIVRYEFFSRAAMGVGANKIAVGHTKDDQAETVLMRLIYGAGFSGLGGIHPVRKFEKFIIVRPLIEVSRFQINAYLKKKRINARIDSTNLENIYKRNKIRNILIPFLEKEYNPNIKDVLSNTAETLRDDYDLFDSYLLEKMFKENINADKNSRVSFNLAEFDKLHISLKKYLIRECIRLANMNLKGIEYRHWQKLEDFIAKRKDSSLMHLPRGCRVKIEGNRVVFYSEKNESTKRINVGANNVHPLQLTILSKVPSIGQIKRDKKAKYLDFDKVLLPLKVRFRRPGDIFMPLGMKDFKKLKDFFIDQKVPFLKRSSIPLAISKGKIVCVGNIQIADFAKIGPDTKKAVKISFSH